MPPSLQSAALSTPERRSEADLQKILDSLIGEAGFVLSGNLPDVLAEYERIHDIIILDPSEYDGLRILCKQHADLELGPKEMFGFLSMIPKPHRPRPTSPTLHLPHSSSLPPSSFRNIDATPTQKRPTSRRSSDRIRSPSDSSSSSGEETSQVAAARRKAERQSSAPPGTFPISILNRDVASRPAVPKRTKTLSDSSRHESPLTARLKQAVPPSAFGFGGAFARPSPASRRRRGSLGGQSSNGEDDLKSPKSPDSPSGVFGRSTSSTSINNFRAGSPPWDPAVSHSRPTSPLAAEHDVDSSSFHEFVKSPEMLGEAGAAEEAFEMPAEHDEGVHDGELNDVEGDIDGTGQGQAMELLNPRLSKISTGSVSSLRTSHDKLQELQKLNSELVRKLKESERQLAVLGAENERLVEDLQEKLEEARAEITQRRKDEKEMKGKERAQLIQISGFEADISSLQRSLEASKANHAGMQKMYNSQCDEAQRLRDLLRDRDEEIASLEQGAEVHGADEEKYSREIEALEAEIKRLEGDLSVARQAESVLDVQKQENLQLKETIDRMRFDLDEARAAVASQGGHTRGVTGSSGPGTLSRNLGDEINRRLMEAERVQESDGESVVETIVTTQRTRRVGNRVVSAAKDGVPNIRVEEGIREYADAGVETDPVAGPSTEYPPAYSRNPEPVDAQDVLEHAHPRHHVPHAVDVDAAYGAVVQGVGVRCSVLEEELEAKRQERAKRRADSFSSPIKSFAERRKSYLHPGIVNYIFHNTESTSIQVGKLAVWSVMAFAIGLAAGSHIWGPTGGIHPRDYHLFAQMNTLASASGAGEGFLPSGQRGLMGIMEGARMAAGKVPT